EGGLGYLPAQGQAVSLLLESDNLKTPILCIAVASRDRLVAEPLLALVVEIFADSRDRLVAEPLSDPKDCTDRREYFSECGASDLGVVWPRPGARQQNHLDVRFFVDVFDAFDGAVKIERRRGTRRVGIAAVDEMPFPVVGERPEMRFPILAG